MSDPSASQPQPDAAPQPHPAGHATASAVPPGMAPQHESPQAAVAPPGAVPTDPRMTRRVLGIQPVLLVGIVLLTLVTMLTIVLIFIGDIETQAPRVAWTVVAFLGFTALLALDLSLARRSALPLVIGVVANVYLLAVLMLATWVEPVVVVPPATECDPYDGCDYADPYRYGPPLAVVLFGVYLLAFLVVRAAAAGAWALVALGRRGVVPFARVMGVVAASLLGLAGIMLTMHLAITPFGVQVGDAYWRIAVVAVVLAALAACITTLLYWNRRQLDRPAPITAVQAAQAGGPAAAGTSPQPWPQQAPQPWPSQPWPSQPWPSQPWPPQPWPPQHGAVPPGWGAPGWQQPAPGRVPNPAGPPQQQHHPQTPPQQQGQQPEAPPQQQPWGPPPQA